ncbi:aldo/keto reductase [Fodinicola acaciae]|uniref:aldo/keto reductase n=1 Tax=Fodinicola acaciae TaxID=2681555 RepID=UPI0013D7A2B0|nr:aldo/keto reductase [Fodinicola acaciae]
MDHVRLGRTGLKVSRLCLGTMTFGLQCDEPAAVAIMDRAAEAGITFLDTADVYPMGGQLDSVGRTEEIVGRWLEKRRDQFILASKCSHAMGPLPWQRGNSRKHILAAVEGSLRRLRTDYIDLYQLHGPDPDTPIDQTLAALDDLVRSGKVRYVGCSNFAAHQVARALGRSEARGLVSFVSVQPRYNLLFRQFERDLLPMCQEEGLAVLPYNPLAGGMLTGKHRNGTPASGTRFTVDAVREIYRSRYWHDDILATVEEIRTLAAEADLSVTSLAVAWVLANPAVTAAIIGASRADQLTDTVAAGEVVLPEDLKDRLDQVSFAYRFGDAAF